MNALATIDDVEVRLGRSLTVNEATRVAIALDDGSASVRSYTGLQFTPGEVTARLQVKRCRVILPQRPVLGVSAVADMNGNPVTFQWFAGDKVTVPANVVDSWSFEPWRNGLQWVDVTYTYGYDPIPDEIVGVVAQKALRALGTSPELAGVSQMGLGDASLSFGPVGAAGAAGFFNEEREVLDRYRRVLGFVRVD